MKIFVRGLLIVGLLVGGFDTAHPMKGAKEECVEGAGQLLTSSGPRIVVGEPGRSLSRERRLSQEPRIRWASQAPEFRDQSPLRTRSGPNSRRSSPRQDELDSPARSPRTHVVWILGADRIPVLIECLADTEDILRSSQLKRHYIQCLVMLVDHQEQLCFDSQAGNIERVVLPPIHDMSFETLIEFCKVMESNAHKRVAIFTGYCDQQAAYIILACWSIFMAMKINSQDNLEIILGDANYHFHDLGNVFEHVCEVDSIIDLFINEAYKKIFDASNNQAKYKNAGAMNLSQDSQALISDFCKQQIRLRLAEI